MQKMALAVLLPLLFVAFLGGCSQTAPVPRETTETGGTFEEWKEKIQDDPEALLHADKCKELMENTLLSCMQHEGFTLNSIMEITDFTADEPYSFQDAAQGGCDSALAVGKTHEPEVTNIQYGTDGSSSYQVVCSSVCVWWQCKEEKESNRGGVATAGAGEVWEATLVGEGGNAYCNGRFIEDFGFTVTMDSSMTSAISRSLADLSSHTVRGNGKFSGSELVDVQSAYPDSCTLEGTTVSNIPFRMEAYYTAGSGSPIFQIWVRANDTLIGGRVFMPAQNSYSNIPAEKLNLMGTDFSTPGRVEGNWRAVGSDNSAHGTFVMTLVTSSTGTHG